MVKAPTLGQVAGNMSGHGKNRATGQGIFTYPDGRKYIGAFRDNKFEGIGSLKFRMGVNTQENRKIGC